MRYAAFDVTDAAWNQCMDALRFGAAKWDLNVDGRPTVARGALVLMAQEHAELVAASQDLYAASLRCQERLRHDVPDNLGLDATARRLGEASRPGPFVTRIDWFQTPDGWMASECNDDVPGGYNEAIGMPAILGEIGPAGCGVPGNLPAALVGLFDGMDRIAVVFATGYAEDLQVAGMISALAAEAGIEAVAASPANLEEAGVARFFGAEVDGIFRFFPSEWFQRLPNVAPWLRVSASEVAVRNPFLCAVTQSKAAFADVRMHEPALRRFLPETCALDDQVSAELLRAPHDWIVKPAFGRMGEGVALGEGSTAQSWRKTVDGARLLQTTRPFVAQRRFRPVPVELSPGVVRTACVGAYVVDGKFAGYYSRIAAGPVVAYNATNLLTLVEGL